MCCCTETAQVRPFVGTTGWHEATSEQKKVIVAKLTVIALLVAGLIAAGVFAIVASQGFAGRAQYSLIGCGSGLLLSSILPMVAIKEEKLYRYTENNLKSIMQVVGTTLLLGAVLGGIGAGVGAGVVVIVV